MYTQQIFLPVKFGIVKKKQSNLCYTFCRITASDELSRNMVDLSNILQALSQVDLGLAIIQNEPNQLVWK